MTMTLGAFLALATGAFAQDVPAQPAGPATYTLSPTKSWLYVVVFNDASTLASGLGHDHGVRAMDFTGKVVWDPANAAACQVEISFPVSALTPDPPGMRARAGLNPEGEVGASSLETIKTNYLGKGQLDALAFPTISYRSTSCEGASGTGKVKVNGNLTIHGVSVPVSTTLDIKADGTSFSAAGSFTATASQFGFKPFSNLGGMLKNKDEMKFVVDVVGSR